MSDGTDYEYSLLKVIAKEKVADTVIFRMSIDPLVLSQIRRRRCF